MDHAAGALGESAVRRSIRRSQRQTQPMNTLAHGPLCTFEFQSDDSGRRVLFDEHLEVFVLGRAPGLTGGALLRRSWRQGHQRLSRLSWDRPGSAIRREPARPGFCAISIRFFSIGSWELRRCIPTMTSTVPIQLPTRSLSRRPWQATVSSGVGLVASYDSRDNTNNTTDGTLAQLHNVALSRKPGQRCRLRRLDGRLTLVRQHRREKCGSATTCTAMIGGGSSTSSSQRRTW